MTVTPLTPDMVAAVAALMIDDGRLDGWLIDLRAHLDNRCKHPDWLHALNKRPEVR